MTAIVIECANNVQVEIKPRVHAGKRMAVGEFSDAEAKAITAAFNKAYPPKSTKDSE